MPDESFKDRTDAGRELARGLDAYAGQPDVIVLGLPRGGVPVAYEVAEELGAPLDVFLVRKLGVPGHEEFAMGAIASGGVRVLDPEVVRMLGIDDGTVEAVAAAEKMELERRERVYRHDRPVPDLRDQTVIVIDDGLATGSTMKAAVRAIRAQHPKKLVVAVPVAARETCEDLRTEVDELVCSRTPEPFRAVGLWYEDFAQTTDDEVRSLLARASKAE
ncbi:MAG: phosphoribosyltransferase [Gemmatimonas sp.]|nr:phosphoribosyltransferase [Gemmatimonas sp.]